MALTRTAFDGKEIYTYVLRSDPIGLVMHARVDDDLPATRTIQECPGTAAGPRGGTGQ
jgi:hypothetical protein